MAMDPAFLALFILRIAGPLILLLTAITLLWVKPPPSTPEDSSPIVAVVIRVLTPRRYLILTLLCLAALTYFLDALLIIILAVITGKWQNVQEPWRGSEIGDFLGLVAFATMAILGTVKEAEDKDVWMRRRVRAFALFACAFDLTIVLLMATSIDFRSDSGRDKTPGGYSVSIPTFSHIVLAVLRLLCSIPLLTALAFPRRTYVPTSSTHTPAAVSSSSLLQPEQRSQYGTFPATPAITNPPSPVGNGQNVLPKKPDPKQEIALDPTWTEMGHRLKRLTPYLWPRTNKALQGLALACTFLLLIGRVVNFAMPWTFGQLVSILERYAPEAPKDYPPGNPWLTLGLYVVLRFLQSPGGLAAMRDSLWAPVMQYSDREMSQLTFDHLLNLSLSFHTRRKTGEILRILDRGASINHILELILFNIFPTIIDMIVALTFFFFYYEWSLALVIFVVMAAYITASIMLTTWRTRIRRKMNDQDVITRGIHTDCLLNYETVKYFGGEDHEGARYAQAIRTYQRYEYQVMLSLNLLNLIQTTIISLGLLAGSIIVANSVVQQRRRPADFVVFITYLAQLYGPLNNLGYIYRSINQSLVDTERLMKLLDEPTDVNDKPDAEDLHVSEAEIHFDNVSFSYDGRSTALKGVTFKVPKGSKVALVGESGSGKSTILRLLYRFYDLKSGEGRILIDGKDVRDVTQHSLRKSIGVVPQDSVLFNTSISYNIGYGKFGASHEEIENAAKLAQMHDRIMSFPDGYDTKVGERGVRLSGGEKQRVAIARTLLKNPPILLLDEATSALDTSTEREIQQALQNLVKGRSSLSIAHRLSTIASADIILVLKDGQIVEQGSHKELLARHGVFAKMWADQVDADKRAQSMGSVAKETSLGFIVDTPIEEEPDKVEVASPEEQPTAPAAIHANAITGTMVDEPITEAEETVEAAIRFPQEDVKEESGPQTATTTAANAPGQFSYAAMAASEPVAESAVHDHAEGAQPDPPAPVPAQVEEATPRVSISAGPEASTPPSGVTFSPSAGTPPSASSTPDPSAPPKRRRLSSQNFQRIARRISLGPRRTDSSGSIGHDAASADEQGDGANTPASSLKEDGNSQKGKKEKKEKKSKKKKT